MNRLAAIRRTDRLLLAACTIVVIALALAVARPLSPTIDERARALDAELRCPICQGTSIADSPAAVASQMRGVVREQLAAGSSDQDVRDFFVARYGRWILLAPTTQGYDVMLWAAPVVLLGGGAWVVLRRVRRRHEVAAPAGTPAKLGRSGMVLLAGVILLALALPIALVVGPRGLGAEMTGSSAGGIQAAPSLVDLEAAVARDPSDAASLVALGDAYLAADRSGDAIAVYERALNAEPDNVPASIALGEILLAAGRPGQAQVLFDRVLGRTPDQPDALLYRALSRYQLGAPAGLVRVDALRFLAVVGNDPRRAIAEQLLDTASPAPSS